MITSVQDHKLKFIMSESSIGYGRTNYRARIFHEKLRCIQTLMKVRLWRSSRLGLWIFPRLWTS